MISAIHLDPTGRAWPVVSPGEGGASVAHGCKRAWRDDALSRREAAYPRAVTNRPDGPQTVAMTAFPEDGDYHENE